MGTAGAAAGRVIVRLRPPGRFIRSLFLPGAISLWSGVRNDRGYVYGNRDAQWLTALSRKPTLGRFQLGGSATTTSPAAPCRIASWRAFACRFGVSVASRLALSAFQ